MLSEISCGHLFWLNYSVYIAKILELPLCFLPSAGLRSVVLNSMLRATQGSIDGAIMAMTKGYAINLSGGYHHASRSNGEGFCVYADITLAIQEVKKFAKVAKTMIIDLDAHMGNGHERDFKNDPNCFIIDFFNPYIFPNDEFAREVLNRFLRLFRQLM